MRDVNDSDDFLGLIDLLFFVQRTGLQHRWELFDLEYSGVVFEGKMPIEIEEISGSGFILTQEQFSLFLQTVNQVIEGVIVARDEESSDVSDEEASSLIKAVIFDGCFWEIGGKLGEDFVASTSLTYLDEY